MPQISFRSVALGAALFVAVPAYAGFSDLMKSAGDMLQGGSIPGLSGTSGSGLSDSLFPPDIPVGKVLSSVVSEGDLDQRVLVDPVADVDALTFVDVMLWEPKN